LLKNSSGIIWDFSAADVFPKRDRRRPCHWLARPVFSFIAGSMQAASIPHGHHKTDRSISRHLFKACHSKGMTDVSPFLDDVLFISAKGISAWSIYRDL
jgi:hypothetical protein